MTESDNSKAGKPELLNYWRWWVFNALLVCGGIWFYLAAQYGTYEFFGRACAMAFLPLIPVVVLVGGAGSSIFILTKVMIEKQSLKRPSALAWLLGPGLAVVLLLVLLGAGKSPAHRLAYICHGNAPPSASRIRVTGYSTYLSEDWLAVFQVTPRDFQTFVAQAELAPADDFEFKRLLDQSAVKMTRLFAEIPPTTGLTCFKRVFKPGEEHERGSIYALFDPATSTAVVFREYRD